MAKPGQVRKADIENIPPHAPQTRDEIAEENRRAVESVRDAPEPGAPGAPQVPGEQPGAGSSRFIAWGLFALGVILLIALLSLLF